jgi:hypothetical protein
MMSMDAMRGFSTSESRVIVDELGAAEVITYEDANYAYTRISY